MSKSDQGQVTSSAAEVYEEFFVPALFQEWAYRVADAAGAQAGQRVLDVACGTGVLARALGDRVGAEGSVVGVDINEGMLAVARRKAPDIEWRMGRAESLPFADDSFDAVVCQFGLMFFEDRPQAIKEMMRVLRPGGRLAVVVWDSLANTPGYAAMAALLQRLFGDEVASSLQAPFVLGDQQILRSLFVEAGVPQAVVNSYEGTARFPSIHDWVYTDIKGWTASDMIDEEGYDKLLVEAERELNGFARSDGSVAFTMPAHIVTATRPQ